MRSSGGGWGLGGMQREGHPGESSVQPASGACALGLGLLLPQLCALWCHSPQSSFLPPRGAAKVRCNHKRKMGVVSVIVTVTARQNLCPVQPRVPPALPCRTQTHSPRHTCWKHRQRGEIKTRPEHSCVYISCIKGSSVVIYLERRVVYSVKPKL